MNTNTEIEYNYMSVCKNGEVIAIFAMEKGSENETRIVTKALETGLDIKKSSKEEYNSFEGEEEEIEY